MYFIAYMISEPSHTRITLALDIIRRLTKGEFAGYHELHIIKHQIDLHDIITLKPSAGMRITCTDPQVPLDNANICWKAVDLVKKECGIDENVHIDIQKNIPVQGGLAGGSANAATVLALVNRLWDLDLTRDQLCRIGRRAGMDVPFYFYGGTAFDTEATGIIQPVRTACRFDFVLVIPEFGVSTTEAYSDIHYPAVAQQKDKTLQMKEALQSNQHPAVISFIHNDFELSVFKRYPELEAIKKNLNANDCQASFMTGSGSTIVGIAKDKDHALWIKNNLHCKSLVVSTLAEKDESMIN